MPGHTVRHQYKEPDAPNVLPPADAMVVAPITCNSLAKWAAGISDTLPLAPRLASAPPHPWLDVQFPVDRFGE
ncbi:MAG: flavoprotein [Pseudonocardiaceae bacterium]